MATAQQSALEAALASSLAAMAAVTDVDRHDSACEALGRKCPRFVPSSEPVLPFLDATGYARRIVAGLPASVEVTTADGGASYEFRKARVVSQKAA